MISGAALVKKFLRLVLVVRLKIIEVLSVTLTCESGAGEDANDFGADWWQAVLERAGEDPVHRPIIHGGSFWTGRSATHEVNEIRFEQSG